MYSVPSALNTHIQQEVTTLCECWKVTLSDGTVMGFTDHDRDLVVSGITYTAATGMSGSAIVQTAGLAVDTSEVVGLIDDDAIDRADFLAGRWDGAEVEHFIVNYASPSDGVIQLPGVTLGEFQVLDQHIVAESRGIKQLIQQAIGWTVQPNCRYDLGDAKCGIDLEALRVSFTVTAVTSQQIFFDTGLAQADDDFGEGEVTWTTGENAGLTMPVRDFVSPAGEAQFKLLLPMPYAIAVGDTGTVVPGCRKRFDEDCGTKYSNKANYGGEPYVPGLLATLRSPG